MRPDRRHARIRGAARLLAPGAWLLRRVPVWGKVLLVAAVLAAPLTISVSAAVTSARRAERTTLAEQSGVPAVVALNRLALALAACSDARLEGRSGADVTGEVATVSDTLVAARVSQRTTAAWERLRSSLQAKQAFAGVTCRVSEFSDSDLQHLADLTVEVSDDVGLSLDSQQSTYYLQLAVTSYVPRLVAALVDVQRQLALNVSRDDAELRRLLQRSSFTVTHSADRLHLVLDRVGQGQGEDLLGLSGELRDWSRRQAQAIDAMADGQATTRETLVLADPDRPMTLASELVGRTSARLAGALAARAAAERREWVETSMAALASLAVVVYLLAALGWSMSRDLRSVRTALNHAVRGESSPSQGPVGRDELGSVAVAVSQAQQQIASLLAQLKRTAARHESYVRQSSDVTVVSTREGRLSYVSPSLESVLGHSPTLWHDTALSDQVEPVDRPAVGRALAGLQRGVTSGEVLARFRHADGRVRHLGARFKDAHDDVNVQGVVWNLRDITEEQELSEQLRHRAFHDDLTGLANRALFLDRLQQALDRTSRTEHSMAVMVLDLDDFKSVNDTLGHQAGDELIRVAGERFLAAVRPGDTVARLGGDEFGIIVEDATGERATVVAQRLSDAMRVPVRLAEEDVLASVSLGVALVDADGGSADGVMHDADTAMYHAKTEGPGLVRFFEPGMLRSDPRAASHEVAALLADDEALSMVFQPICDLRDATVVGYEALTRFPGREHRRVDEWFRLARDCGQGAALEARALRLALASAEALPEGVFLSVNVSPSTLSSAAVQSVLDRDLTGIVVEITEDAELDADLVDQAVRPVRERGGRIAVDDTGAGYANLKQLVRLRPDIVKLDRELITSVNEHLEKRALVEALVSFCARTGSVLCAEGVELVEELVTVADLGVHLAQGWALGMPSADFGPASTQALLALGGDVPRGRTSDLSPVHARLAAAGSPLEVAEALRTVTRLMYVDDIAMSIVRDTELVVVSRNGWVTENSVYAIEDYPATARALATGQLVPIRADDPGADPDETRLLREIGFGSMLLVPVRDGDTPLALVELYAKAARPWSEQELALAQECARSATAALRRINPQVPHASDVPDAPDVPVGVTADLPV